MKHYRILTASVLILLAVSAAGLTFAKRNDLITKDQLVEMFDNLPKEPGWDPSKPLLWGYFFTDPSKEKLQSVAPLLEQQGYRFVDIFLSEKDDPEEPDLWWLHVEKIETHDPHSLDQRNQMFYLFADEHEIDSYDGMDVGPAPARH